MLALRTEENGEQNEHYNNVNGTDGERPSIEQYRKQELAEQKRKSTYNQVSEELAMGRERMVYENEIDNKNNKYINLVWKRDGWGAPRVPRRSQRQRARRKKIPRRVFFVCRRW